MTGISAAIRNIMLADPVQRTEALNRAAAIRRGICPTCRNGDAPPDEQTGATWECAACGSVYGWRGDE